MPTGGERSWRTTSTFSLWTNIIIQTCGKLKYLPDVLYLLQTTLIPIGSCRACCIPLYLAICRRCVVSTVVPFKWTLYLIQLIERLAFSCFLFQKLNTSELFVHAALLGDQRRSPTGIALLRSWVLIQQIHWLLFLWLTLCIDITWWAWTSRFIIMRWCQVDCKDSSYFLFRIQRLTVACQFSSGLLLLQRYQSSVFLW